MINESTTNQSNDHQIPSTPDETEALVIILHALVLIDAGLSLRAIRPKLQRLDELFGRDNGGQKTAITKKGERPK
jgi:hypothetical protein